MLKAIVVILLGAVLVYVGYMVWYVGGEKKADNKNYGQIRSFEDCAAAGFQIRESYPEQCATPDGRTFTKQN